MIRCTCSPSLVPIHLGEINEVEVKHCAKLAFFFSFFCKKLWHPGHLRLILKKALDHAVSITEENQNTEKALKLIFFHRAPCLKNKIEVETFKDLRLSDSFFFFFFRYLSILVVPLNVSIAKAAEIALALEFSWILGARSRSRIL